MVRRRGHDRLRFTPAAVVAASPPKFMRIVFMGSPESAVPGLARLLEDGHDVVAVVTQPDRPSGRKLHLAPPPIKIFAALRGLPIEQPSKIRTDEFAEWMQSTRADVAVVIAYGRILPRRVLDLPRFGCVNLHFSLLPKYRGAAPVNWAIAAGETVTGVTTIQMDAGLDTGPILMQQPADIGGEETAPELLQRLAGIGASLLSETITRLGNGSIRPQSQDHDKATLAPLLAKSDGSIRWTEPASRIRNLVRGMQPWPCAWTRLGDSLIKVWRARTGEDSSSEVAAGTITAIDDEVIEVACGEGSRLRILELQRESQRRLRTREFANGARLHTGLQFRDGNQP